MAYVKTNWVDGTTPLSAANLNHIENGIAAAVPLDGSVPMTGPLTLPADPTSALEAVTKQYAESYADNNFAKLTISLADNTDLNTIVTSGFYRLNNTPINAPSDVSYGQLIVSKGVDTVFQIITGFNGSTYYMRQAAGIGTSPTWQPWRKLWHDGNLLNPAQTDVDNAFSTHQTSENASMWGGLSFGFNRDVTSGALFNTAYGAIQFQMDTPSNTWQLQAYNSAGAGLTFPMSIDLTNGKVKIIQGIDTANNGQYFQFRKNTTTGGVEYSLDGGTTWTGVGGVKNVQRGSTIVNGNTTTNVTITSVDMTKSFVNLSSVEALEMSGSSSFSHSLDISGYLTSSTNLAFTNSGDAGATMYWEVVESY